MTNRDISSRTVADITDRESAEARAQLTQIAQRIGRSPAAVRTRWYQLHDDSHATAGR